jgi:competence protein ComEA
MLYSRPQLKLLLALAATFLVGLGVREWRAGFPDLAERLEHFDREQPPAGNGVPAEHAAATAAAGSGSSGPRGGAHAVVARAEAPSVDGDAPAGREARHAHLDTPAGGLQRPEDRGRAAAVGPAGRLPPEGARAEAAASHLRRPESPAGARAVSPAGRLHRPEGRPRADATAPSSRVPRPEAARGTEAAAARGRWPLDINRASAAELARLPGVGQGLAERILAERERRGRFQSAEALRSVLGVGPKKLAAIRDLVTAGEQPRETGEGLDRLSD